MSFRVTSDNYPPASLGCGTLIIIGLIVLFVTRTGSERTEEEVRGLGQQVEALKAAVDRQTEEIRGLKELVQGHTASAAPKPDQDPAKK